MFEAVLHRTAKGDGTFRPAEASYTDLATAAGVTRRTAITSIQRLQDAGCITYRVDDEAHRQRRSVIGLGPTVATEQAAQTGEKEWRISLDQHPCGLGVQIEADRIYNVDCLAGMGRMKSHVVSLILTDLPYAVTQNGWDVPINLEELWTQFIRVLKRNGVIVLTAQCPFDKVLAISNLHWLRHELIWRKNNVTGFLNAERAPMRAHETILVFAAGEHTYNPQKTLSTPYKRRGGTRSTNYNKSDKAVAMATAERYPTSVLEFDVERGLHPTQKPVSLFSYLIRTYSNPGELVLDATIGSGTTAIAAVETGRKFIGFESDPAICNGAIQRVEAWLTRSIG